jgi:hypothetical protein
MEEVEVTTFVIVVLLGTTVVVDVVVIVTFRVNVKVAAVDEVLTLLVDLVDCFVRQAV